MPHLKKVSDESLKDAYISGLSCAEIGKLFSMSRQAVHERLVRLKVPLRQRTKYDFIIYDGLKFTPSGNGYYRATVRCTHISLHRYKYNKEVGAIPDGYDIHHIDGNKLNNNLNNLECLSKSEHTRLHSPHHNQYKNYKTIGDGTWIS